MDEFYTAADAARLLKIDVKRVQALARQGRLPATRIGRKWLIPRSELEARLGRQAASPPQAGLEISGRNQLRGKVIGVTPGDVLAEVRVRVGDQEVVSIITRSSVERLGLTPGDNVIVIVKSTDVMIGKP